jgi:hypothetical protein
MLFEPRKNGMPLLHSSCSSPLHHKRFEFNKGIPEPDGGLPKRQADQNQRIGFVIDMMFDSNLRTMEQFVFAN